MNTCFYCLSCDSLADRTYTLAQFGVESEDSNRCANDIPAPARYVVSVCVIALANARVLTRIPLPSPLIDRISTSTTCEVGLPVFRAGPALSPDPRVGVGTSAMARFVFHFIHCVGQ